LAEHLGPMHFRAPVRAFQQVRLVLRIGGRLGRNAGKVPMANPVYVSSAARLSSLRAENSSVQAQPEQVPIAAGTTKV
jgi:hypothetical protein